MHPCIGVATHGDASGDSAGEGGGVSHYNPCESCCDLHLWWYCKRMSDRACIISSESNVTWWSILLGDATFNTVHTTSLYLALAQ